MSLLRNIGVGKIHLIKEWMSENVFIFSEYTIEEDLTINVKGSVHLFRDQEKLPDYIQFGEVTGSFRSSYVSHLVSLRGFPKTVGADLICTGCSGLTSFDGGPEIVGRDANFYFCPIESIQGCPKKVGESFMMDAMWGDLTESNIRKHCLVKQVYTR